MARAGGVGGSLSRPENGFDGEKPLRVGPCVRQGPQAVRGPLRFADCIWMFSHGFDDWSLQFQLSQTSLGREARRCDSSVTVSGEMLKATSERPTPDRAIDCECELLSMLRSVPLDPQNGSSTTKFFLMPVYIEMPKLADTMTEGKLVRWRKQVGDSVKTGDVLAEVETDKATMEMESFDDGTLHKHLMKEGEKVAIGAKIAVLLKKGEAAPSDADIAAATQGGAAVSPTAAAAKAPAASAPAPVQGAGSPASVAVPSAGGRLRTSPLARKIAAERGVALANVAGTGPGGRIVAKDVLSARQGPASNASPSVSAAPAIPPMPAGPNDMVIELSGMRRVIADRLLASKTQIPHFYLHVEVDADPLMKFRSELNAASEAAGGPKLTVNDFVLKAVVAAAVKVPAVNASFAGDSIIQYGSVNLSVAVAVDDGLVTPVVRDAQKRSIKEISEAIKDLATRARGKKLKPDEYQGGTITVSNLGAYGIEFFDAIINPPQSVIVSVGAILKKPVVGPNNTIIAGQRMAIGVSADHRVVDGAVAAQYLAEVKRLLESPSLMLV